MTARRAIDIGEPIGRNPGMLDRAARRQQVLEQYTANADFPVLSSIISNETEWNESDRARMKLTKLKTISKAERSLETSQIELISIIERMDRDLKNFWDRGDRVRALRVTIQATKLMGITKVPQCYPSVFILASTVLDTFGDLVADRIRETAAQESPLVASLLAQGKEPNPSLIPPQAVEMCNNWFLKILSIRELLPRVYVELSLMRTYKYVAHRFRIESMQAVVSRLAMQLRGVADPLVATYARFYVCLRAAEVLKGVPNWADGILLCCEDTLQLVMNLPQEVYESKLLSRASYVSLLSPALQWMVDTVARHGSPTVAEQFLERTLRMMETTPSLCFSSIAAIFTSAFHSRHLFPRMSRCVNLIASNDFSMTFDATPRLRVVGNICHALAEVEPPLPYSKEKCLRFVNVLWEVINADRVLLDPFLQASRGMLRLLAVHASNSQVTVLLQAVNERLIEATAGTEKDEAEGGAEKKATSINKQSVRNLVGMAIAILSPRTLYSMWSLLVPMLQLLDATEREEMIRQVLKMAPTTFRFSTVVLDLCRQLHDNLSDATPAEIAAQTRDAVCTAIRACFSTEDIEQQLRFLADCRHGLSQLDDVKVTVIEEATRLVAHLVASGAATSKSKRAAAKGCLAFCHVTAPAINDAPRRVRVCTNAAAFAFHHGFVAQAEAMLVLAISGLREVLYIEQRPDRSTRDNSHAMVSLSSSLLHLSVAAPPHAKYGPLYGVSSIVEWADSFPWPAEADAPWRIGAAVLRLVGALKTGRLAYHFKRCPDPRRMKDDPQLLAVACSLQHTALGLLNRGLPGAGGPCALAAVEAMASEFKRNREVVGNVLQQSLKALNGAGRADFESDVAYLRQRVAVTAWAKDVLTPEILEELLTGEDIPAFTPPEGTTTGAAASEDENSQQAVSQG